MASHIIYKAATAATDGTTIAHPVFNATPCESITVSAPGLDTAGEEVDIYRDSAGTWEVARDINGVALKLAATAATNNARQIVLEGGTWYQFRKDTTAAACAIVVTEGPMRNC